MPGNKPGRRYAGVVASSHLRSELDRLVQEVLAARDRAGRGGWTPPIDVLDTGSALVVLVEVAGLSTADIRVEVESNQLRIKGRRRLTFPVAGRVRFHCLERQEGAFERQLEVGVPVDFRRAAVTLTSGLLRIELPKVEERRTRVQTLPITDEEGEEPPR
jgi:HSP20 family molecular chaperone IbpA